MNNVDNMNISTRTHARGRGGAGKGKLTTRTHARGALHLHLCFCFYDAIERGDKRVEYRDATDYWKSRLRVPPESVILSRGYTKDEMEFAVDRVACRPVGGRPCFCIHLGKRKR